MHPVELVYQRMTKIVSPAMPLPDHVDEPCSYCGRLAREFGHMGFPGKDGYKQPITCCPACHSFSVGDVDITGIESIRGKGNKVPNKFGMWPGVSAAFEVHSNRAVLLAPQGVYDKLPASFLDMIETHVLPKSSRIPWVVRNLKFPLVYIADFGKTTSGLIANLRVSESPKEMLCATDKTVERIDASASLDVFEALSELPKSEVELFFTTVRGVALGTITPRKANSVWAEHPSLVHAVRTLPIDPHQRLSLLSLVRNMRG
ncbi:hypothetical protein [Marinobacterium sp. BA1]|uniref:hypothetical protein n=1 Tax=Marinobacterium sp. BA1 TaxID=3138931 RepID=UPI0032E6DF7B